MLKNKKLIGIMTRQEINSVLRKTLKSGGSRFDSLFTEVKCEVFKNGHGNPQYILGFMKDIIDTHYTQVSKLAEKLKTSSLKSTVNAFHRFPYDYIQYDVDGYQQNVLSPACAWQNRLSGMDCKSFTVFTASLCKAVGIKTFLRQIKQGDDRVSHVYLVVPIDQKTGSLDQGHYVIDATTQNNKEVEYTWKNDLNMNLPVVGMNAPGMACDYSVKNPNDGMGFSFSDITGLVTGGGSGDGDSGGGDILSTGGGLVGGPLGAGIGNLVSGLIGGAFSTAGSASQGKEDAKLDGVHFLKTSGIEFAVNEQTFNRFIFLTENYYQARFAKSKWDQTSATKEGNRLAAEGMKDLQNDTLAEVQKSYEVKQTGTVPMAADRSISTVGGWHGTTLPTTAFGSWTVPTYSLSPKKESNQSNNVSAGNTNQTARLGGLSTTGGIIGLVILLSAIIGGTIYFKK